MPAPYAKRQPHDLVHHGIERVDEYYWLRDDERASPEVLAYLRAETEYAAEVLAPTEQTQKTLYEELRSRISDWNPLPLAICGKILRDSSCACRNAAVPEPRPIGPCCKTSRAKTGSKAMAGKIKTLSTTDTRVSTSRPRLAI